jgi:hypothetical protein
MQAIKPSAAADRIEALLAEVAGLRAEWGRVPESWDECADWLEWFGPGCVLVDGEPTSNSVDDFNAQGRSVSALRRYRLLPPPNLVAAPPKMDGGGFLGAGADVPEGWEWRVCLVNRMTKESGAWYVDNRPAPEHLVQCRPPVKPATRVVVEVPLTKLVGRTIEGETEKVAGYASDHPLSWRSDAWKWVAFPAGTLDLDAGMVRVYAEDGES